MNTISLGATGAAVEDVQQRLHRLGFLEESAIDGVFAENTAQAVQDFLDARSKMSVHSGDKVASENGDVTDKVWAALVDASYNLGDRTLYLRMPYFHGQDVFDLQSALGALGFICGDDDGIFGAHTEDALRKFQMNLGLPSDGIAGAYTYAALHNLEHSWAGKGALTRRGPLGFARASDVLERVSICLFGIDDFTRSIASRMSNLAYATNPSSKFISADMLSVPPDENALFVQIDTEMRDDTTPTVVFSDEDSLADHMHNALDVAKALKPTRIRVVFPERSWMEAGEARTAQHYAISLLDALCIVL